MAETFKEWFARNLPDLHYFTAEEFLEKGASHYRVGRPGYQLNTDPPRELWPNIIQTAYILDALRHRLGVPIRINSAYRSPEYNSAIGGARASQHKEFRAIDFQVSGRGRPADWGATLRSMRDRGLFAGGVGVYRSFVHVDTGRTRDWFGSGGDQPGRVLEPARTNQDRLDINDPALPPPGNDEDSESKESPTSVATVSSAAGGATLATGFAAVTIGDQIFDWFGWFGVGVFAAAIIAGLIFFRRPLGRAIRRIKSWL